MAVRAPNLILEPRLKEIPLACGRVALVDDIDYEQLSRFKWHLSYYGYPSRVITRHPLRPGKRTRLFMHRIILNLDFGDARQGDHADLNKLNNQRSNLRICTSAENCANKPATARNVSGFKGVSPIARKANPWIAAICVNGKSKHLGVFKTAEEAYTAYCAAAEELHGKFANFGKAT